MVNVILREGYGCGGGVCRCEKVGSRSSTSIIDGLDRPPRRIARGVTTTNGRDLHQKAEIVAIRGTHNYDGDRQIEEMKSDMPVIMASQCRVARVTGGLYRYIYVVTRRYHIQ